MTSQVELGRFFQQVRAYQAAPGSRTKAHHDGAGPQAADELAQVTEMLLTAEEELRVQSEQLSATRLELDRVYAQNEELFGAAPTAYVITDTDGFVVDANRAAWKLLGFRTASGARRPMVSMIAAQDRHRARTLVRQAVAAGGKSVTADLMPATGLDRDEAVRDVVVNDVVVSVGGAHRTAIGNHAAALAADAHRGRAGSAATTPDGGGLTPRPRDRSGAVGNVDPQPVT